MNRIAETRSAHAAAVRLRFGNPGRIGSAFDLHSTRPRREADIKGALLQLLSAQSESLAEHLVQVAELATDTAVSLGLSPRQVWLTRLAAELHDIGKVGIPASILDKPGPLSLEEQWFMQRHSEIGESIVAAAPALEAIAPIVRAVHERPDGHGYPDGLTRQQIPIPSLVIAVVDAFDAMTSDRPYQAAVAPEVALAEVRCHAGTQFDPLVVEAFARGLANRAPATLARVTAA